MSIIPTMFISMVSKLRGLIVLIAVLGIAACAQVESSATPTVTKVRDILAYKTPTADMELLTSHVVTPIIATPKPSATPFSHIVEKGETMLGIAIRYGIELEDLQAANSGVDPNMLSVGTQLIIPLNKHDQDIVLTPTPVPLTLSSPDCYPTLDRGAWCFVLVENNYPFPLENVSARVNLFSQQGDFIGEGTAFYPLNLIGSNERAPLMVFFSPPVPVSFKAEASLLTGVVLPSDDDRYIESAVEIDDVIHQNEMSAIVKGEVIFGAGARYPSVVWLVVVAYSESGDVVGVRKWEVNFPQTDKLPLSTGIPDESISITPLSISPLPYEIVVYSLGPAIERVEVLSEARP